MQEQIYDFLMIPYQLVIMYIKKILVVMFFFFFCKNSIDIVNEEILSNIQ